MTTTTTRRDLDAAYSTCRAVHRRHGTTYYWAAHVLPARQRRHVHALYAYCRLADEIVDDLGAASPAMRRAALTAFGDRTVRALRRRRTIAPPGPMARRTRCSPRSL